MCTLYVVVFLDLGCNHGTWGYDCKTDCGECANDADCDNKTGACPSHCEPGFKGTNCDSGKFSLGAGLVYLRFALSQKSTVSQCI